MQGPHELQPDTRLHHDSQGPCSSLAQMLDHIVCYEEGSDVRGHAVKTAAVHNLDMAPGCLLMIAAMHLSDPWKLTCTEDLSALEGLMIETYVILWADGWDNCSCWFMALTKWSNHPNSAQIGATIRERNVRRITLFLPNTLRCLQSLSPSCIRKVHAQILQIFQPGRLYLAHVVLQPQTWTHTTNTPARLKH